MNRLLPCSKPSYKAVAVILLAAMVFMILFGLSHTVFALEYEPEQSYANYDKERTLTSRFIRDYGQDSGNELFESQMTFAEFYFGDPTVGSGIFSDFSNYYSYSTGWVDNFLPRNLGSYYMFSPVNYQYYPENSSTCYNMVSAPTITLLFNLNGSFENLDSMNGGIVIGYMHTYINWTAQGFIFKLIGYSSDISSVQSIRDFDRIVCYYGVSFDTLESSFELENYDSVGYLISFTLPPQVFRVPNSSYYLQFTTRMPCSSYLYCSVPRFSSVNDPGTINTSRSNESLLLDYVSQTLNFSLFDSIKSTEEYEQGYSDGYNKGSQNAYTNAYNQGLDVGYNNGYQTGYNNGLSVGEGNIDSTISNFVPSILGGVADFIIKVLDFQVFGISVLNVLGTVGVLLILVAFIKMIT